MVLHVHKKLLLLTLLVGGLSLTACSEDPIDGETPSEDDIQACADAPSADTCDKIIDYCDKNPTVGACKDVNDFCDENQDDPACARNDGKVDCEETPNDPACDDGKVDCEKTPNDPACDDGNDETPSEDDIQACADAPSVDTCDKVIDYCDKNPTVGACNDVNDFCAENQDDPACGSGDGNLDCEETPDDPECQTNGTACVDENGALTQEAKDQILEALQLQNSPNDTIPTVSVETVTEVPNPDYNPESDDEADATIKASNYRVLTFNLPVNAGPLDPNAPRVSKLYLDIDANEFLNISDEDGLTNADWDLAFDPSAYNYIYANSGYSGGYFGNWPAGLRIAKTENVNNQAELLAVPGADLSSEMTLEQWYDTETCTVLKTNWKNPDPNAPDFVPSNSLPQTIIGAWYNYQWEGHQMVPQKNAFSVYDSGNRHHVYTFQILSFNSGTGEVKLAVHDEFQQNACKEADAVQELMSVSDTPVADLPVITADEITGVTRPGVDDDDQPIEVPVDYYHVLNFTLPNSLPENSSKLYLDIQHEAFLDISDAEALGFAKDADGETIRNENWHIAIDVHDNNTVYLRSGQSGGYMHLDKYVTGYQPRGVMGYNNTGIADEDAFTAWDAGADARNFSTEDLITDVDDASCPVDGELIIGDQLFNVDNGSAFGIYTSGPCHKVWQIKVLDQEDTDDGLDVQLGVILANPGIPSPACN